MKQYKYILGFFSLFLLIGFFGCGEADTKSDAVTKKGSISVLLTDAPGDYRAVYVSIEKILVHKSGESTQENNETSYENNETQTDAGWITVAQPNKTYDLLTLQNGITQEMGEHNISTGKYTQVRLVLSSQEDNGTNILGDTHPYANYIVLVGDDVTKLKVPSNTIKYNHNFEILEDNATVMTIDFDANKSIIQRGNGEWILKPVLDVKSKKVKGEV